MSKEKKKLTKEVFQNFSRFLVVFIVFEKVLTFWAPAELKKSH